MFVEYYLFAVSSFVRCSTGVSGIVVGRGGLAIVSKYSRCGYWFVSVIFTSVEDKGAVFR